ncbi:MAG: Kdo hydroxylase family protein, partial [Candidatus Acidiferrales bacterium]
MPAWLEIDRSSSRTTPTDDRYVRALESGQVLFFPTPPIDLPNADRDFLVAQRRGDSAVHKNVSFRPSTGILRGWSGDRDTRDRLCAVLGEFSARARAFVCAFLPAYAAGLQMDYTSFRPLEEAGRQLPLHKRNDLLHVDAFPSRPTRGGRILRFFINLHPEKKRVWNVGQPFDILARQYAADAGLEKIAGNRGGSIWRRFAIGRARYSAYDRFMLHFHDYLKENSAYQSTGEKTRLEFPPGSAWLAYTDGVPHAVLSGQHAIEQTFI